jgi:tRNA (guanine37-N1)-methyltransferase
VRFDVLALFCEEIAAGLRAGMVGRAAAQGVLTIEYWQIRNYAPGKHRQVDDTPYGGGAGMVMKVDPIVAALRACQAASGARGHVVLLTPTGERLTQKVAMDLAQRDRVIVVCGHYEGIDERVRDYVDQELSLGDFVLSAGEIAAMALIDAVGRLLPGVLGNDVSAADESFSSGLLEYPQYTRPEVFEGKRVPEVLLSGHHGEVAKWRRSESLKRTLERRPELLETATLTDVDRKLLEELQARTELDILDKPEH